MYNCSNCPFVSDFDFSVESHLKSKHPIYPRKELFDCLKSSLEKRLCPEWDYETHLKVDFDTHVRSGHGFGKKKLLYEVHQDVDLTKEQCEDCNCNFQTFSKFNWFAHQFTTHENLALEPEAIFVQCAIKSEAIDEIKWFHCNHCSFKTKTAKYLPSHIKKRHILRTKKTSFECDQCPFKTNKQTFLTRHKLRKHVPDSEKIFFDCDQCSYKTHYKDYLIDHKYKKHRNDDEVKWHYCDQCLYKAKTAYNLSAHVNRKHMTGDANNKKQSLECDQCSFKTFHKSDLQRHKQCHASEDEIKWFTCDQCSYKSNRAANLSNHIKRIHIPDDEKICFECDQCPFKTFEKYNLERHKSTQHKPDDQIRWFYCGYCPHRAKVKRHLNDHVRRKHANNAVIQSSDN